MSMLKPKEALRGSPNPSPRSKSNMAVSNPRSDPRAEEVVEEMEAPYGENVLVFSMPQAMMGSKGLTDASKTAILNANYMGLKTVRCGSSSLESSKTVAAVELSTGRSPISIARRARQTRREKATGWSMGRSPCRRPVNRCRQAIDRRKGIAASRRPFKILSTALVKAYRQQYGRVVDRTARLSTIL